MDKFKLISEWYVYSLFNQTNLKVVKKKTNKLKYKEVNQQFLYTRNLAPPGPFSSCSLRSHQCGGVCQVEVSLTFFLIHTDARQTDRMQLYKYRY